MLPLGAAGDRPGDTLFFAANGRILGVNGLVFRAVFKILNFSAKICKTVATLALCQISLFFPLFKFRQKILGSRDFGFFGILAKNGQNSRRFYYDLRPLSFWTNFLFRDFGFLGLLVVENGENRGSTKSGLKLADTSCIKAFGVAPFRRCWRPAG